MSHFVWHHNDSVDLILVQLLPEGNSHVFGLYSPNLVTDQDKIDVFMDTIGNSVYTKKFDNQDQEKIDKKIYLEASSNFLLIPYKWKINMTLYNVYSVLTNYFYHHDD